MTTQEELEMFLAYETSNSFICSLIFWKSGQKYMANKMLAKTRRKYLNYKQFMIMISMKTLEE